MNIGLKIKKFRIQKGYSQDELATKAGLSLRTIQRIELNETLPRGYTLNSIADALGITRPDLLNEEIQKPSNAATLINLSALGFIVFPLFGFLCPLIVWMIKNNKTNYDNLAARRLLNFQATWCILLFVIYITAFSGKFFHLPWFGTPETIMISIALMYLINLVFVVLNVIQSGKSKVVFYQPAIPFFK